MYKRKKQKHDSHGNLNIWNAYKEQSKSINSKIAVLSKLSTDIPKIHLLSYVCILNGKWIEKKNLFSQQNTMNDECEYIHKMSLPIN